jgi:sulfur relay (sulfurtransferase) complex TusBCD TusD component (DsrE family)
MSDTLILLNDPPYGTERSFNGLRLALALPKADLVEGARRSSMEELARRTLAADKVLVF